MNKNKDRPYLHDLILTSTSYNESRTYLCEKCLAKTSCRELNLIVSSKKGIYVCVAEGCDISYWTNPKSRVYVIDLPKITLAEYIIRMNEYE